jgi:hypothetical protein
VGLRWARRGYEGLGRASQSLKFTRICKKKISVFAENFSVFAESVSVFAENDSVYARRS